MTNWDELIAADEKEHGTVDATVNPKQWLWDRKNAQHLRMLGIDDIYDAAIRFGRLDYRPWGDEVKVQCPNPEHNDNNPSCSIWLSINAFKCWSCGCSGSLSRFVYLLEEEQKHARRNTKSIGQH